MLVSRRAVRLARSAGPRGAFLVWSRAEPSLCAPCRLCCTLLLWSWISKWSFSVFFLHVPTFVTDKEQMIGLLAICVQENWPHRACILEATVL